MTSWAPLDAASPPTVRIMIWASGTPKASRIDRTFRSSRLCGAKLSVSQPTGSTSILFPLIPSLILVTSHWVKETYIRDGIRGNTIEVLPVGCDTDSFAPHSRDDLKVRSIREALGVSDDQIMILTVGGDAASKGAQEVMQALALIDAEAPDWR